MDERFNQIMIVFKYIDDKDIFQKFYTKFFANRLIKDTYASEDAEENMINKLKGKIQNFGKSQDDIFWFIICRHLRLWIHIKAASNVPRYFNFKKFE